MFRRLALIGIVVLAGLIIVLLLTSGRKPQVVAPPPPPPPRAMRSSEVVVGWELPLSDLETGERVGLISATEAVVHKDKTVDVTDPVITLTRQPDRPVTITAPTGTVNIEEKSAVLRASSTRRVEIQAVGAQEPMSMEADEVHWNSALKQITTVGPVSMTVGRARIMGSNLRSEAEMTQFILPEDVRVVLAGSPTGLLGAPGDPEEAIRVTCAGELEFDRSANQATFRDDVRLTQGKRTLRCDRLDILLEQTGGGRALVSRASARGDAGRPIRITEADGPDQEPISTLTGSAADYEAQTGILVISGPVEAQDPKWSVTGMRMSIDRARHLTTIEGSPARAEGAKERLEASTIILDESQEPHLLIARGTPAHAYRGPNYLTGRELRMVQDTGVLTVPGPGTLRWFSKRGLTGVTGGGSAEAGPEGPQQDRAIDVAWTESMRFAEGRAQFEGSVKARQETTTLSAGHLEITFDETASNVRELTARNAVEIVDPPQTIRAEHFSFDLLSKVMRATGTAEAPAQVWFDRDVLRAPTITFEQETGNVETDGPGFLLYHKGAGPTVEPLQVTWRKRMTYDSAEGVARFEDEVEFVRQSLTLNSDRLALFFAGAGEGAGLATSLEVQRAVASGRVAVTEPTGDRTLRRATGDTLTWDAQAATLTLVGEPVLIWQGRNVIKSPQVLFYSDQHLFLASGPGRLIVYNDKADVDQAPEGVKWQKVQINWSRQLRYETLSRQAQFSGDVFLREGRRTLYARDTVTADFSQDDKATLTRAVAEGESLGDVAVTQGDRSGLGTWFEWDMAADSVELRGTPYATFRQGANEIQGRGFRFEKDAVVRAEGTTFVDFLQH